MTKELPARLLLVIPKQSSYRFFLARLGQRLAGAGVEVHCACAVDASAPAGHFVIFHDLPMPRGMNPLAHRRSGQQLNRLIAEIKPDIIHAHFSASIFTVAVAKQKHWPPTLGTFQGLRFPLEQSRVMSRVFRRAELWSIAHMNGSWVVTGDDLEAVLRYGPTSRIFLQPGFGFGCEVHRFDPTQFGSVFVEQFRTELGIAPTDIVFIFVGRFVEFKGFALTVRAFLQLKKIDPCVKLLLVGKRDPLHPSGLSSSEEQELGNVEGIVNVGHQQEVERYLAVADIMVFPSEREGVPVCLMESLSMGVPVITRNSRGCRDVVRDGIDGIVIHDCTVANLREAMGQLAQDGTRREQFRANAIKDRERFDRARYVDVQMGIYRDLGLE
jgi:glycosyltransferase involved in cell wall biosynthesis